MRLPVFLWEDGLVTDAQVRRLREKRMSGKTLAAAAAAAGMSERTARRCQSGGLPSTAKAPRTWRTREDPFANVWQSEVVPQLVADTEGRLQALTLFMELWCARLTGEGQPVEVRRKEGVRTVIDIKLSTSSMATRYTAIPDDAYSGPSRSGPIAAGTPSRRE